MELGFQIKLEIFIFLALGSISFLVRKRLLRNHYGSIKYYLFYGLILLFIPFVIYLLVLALVNAGTYDVSNCPFYEFSREPCTLFDYLQLQMLIDALVGLPLYIFYVLFMAIFWGVGWCKVRNVTKGDLVGY